MPSQSQTKSTQKVPLEERFDVLTSLVGSQVEVKAEYGHPETLGIGRYSGVRVKDMRVIGKKENGFARGTPKLILEPAYGPAMIHTFQNTGGIIGGPIEHDSEIFLDDWTFLDVVVLDGENIDTHYYFEAQSNHADG